MDNESTTPTRVGNAPVGLRRRRAGALTAALLSDREPECICGCGHPEDNDSDECDT